MDLGWWTGHGQRITVEGLTVTYMPRHPGVGNADTLQQRGRFFGYKRPYLGFCRIYVEQQVLTAFEEYVVHEEEMRRQLEEVRDRNESLTEWKRAFILSPALRPCRANVIRYEYARGTFSIVGSPPELCSHQRLSARTTAAPYRGICAGCSSSPVLDMLTAS